MAAKYILQMVIKYTIIFMPRPQDIPKLGILVRKSTIWQPWYHRKKKLESSLMAPSFQGRVRPVVSAALLPCVQYPAQLVSPGQDPFRGQEARKATLLPQAVRGVDRQELATHCFG
jgi:hypothetical protein